MLRSDFCDFSDFSDFSDFLWFCDFSAYIVAEGTLTVKDPNNNAYDKKLALKSNTPLTSCISKINNTLIDNAENLDIVMSMNNLIKYSKNYRKITASLWN